MLEKSYIYQTGTINSLLDAVYDGDVQISDLAYHGDFGIGALDSIDGEMILHHGICYRADAEGKLSILNNFTKTPFAMVNKFQSEIEFRFEDNLSFMELEEYLLKKLPSKNLIYAIEIIGNFVSVNLRSEHCTCKPYRKLVEILPDLQTTFSFENISGTLVGFWFPQYMNQLNIPGFHFHFIDDDKKIGGHVFGLNITSGTCKIQTLHGFRMELINTNEFHRANLGFNNQRDVAQVEQIRT